MQNDSTAVVVEIHNISPAGMAYTALCDDGTKVIVHDFQIKSVIKRDVSR